MGARRDGHQVAGRTLLPVDRLDELVEDLGVGLVFAKVDDVDVDLLFLELLGQLDQVFLVSLMR